MLFKRREAFSLIELSIAMGIAVILASSIVPIAIRSFQAKAANKTADEITMLQDASRNYYLDHSAWPLDIDTLKAQGYLNAQWIAVNPWRNPYQLAKTSSTLSITTAVPEAWTSLVASHVPAAVITGGSVFSTITSMEASIVAAGIIVAWSGAIADIPQGWALCDGTQGTPDLRDKFIVGARQDIAGIAKTNITGALLQTGGTISHTHGGTTGAHVLTVAQIPQLTVTIPGFTPNQGGNAQNAQMGSGAADSTITSGRTNGGGQGHSHTIATDMHIPPFYALAYIMKL